MATTIKLKNSVTTTNAPSSLAQGEVAINVTDKKMWVGNAATTPVQILGAGTTGTAAGSNTQVQYNSSGTLAGDADFTFNGTTVTMANDASISGLTVGKGGGADSVSTAVGSSALATNLSGVGNSAFGRNALTLNTTGSSNNAFGRNSLLTNTTGSSNVAIGNDSLASNTTASNNTAVGYQSSYANTTGAQNTAIGRESLKNNIDGSYHTAIGYQSLFSQNGSGVLLNTAIGNASMFYNTTGSYNVGLGASALYSNTTASNNTAVGYQALYSLVGGGSTRNTALGYGAGQTTTASYSTFVGALAGNLAQNGGNTLIGYAAGVSITTGTNNTFIGARSDSTGSGEAVTTGSKNTILGSYTGNQGGLDIRTASNYIVLSDGDGNPRLISNDTGKIAIATQPASNVGLLVYNTENSGINVLHNRSSGQSFFSNGYSASGTGWMHFNGVSSNNSVQNILIYGNGNIVNANNSYGAISDAKLKENIVDATPKLDKLMQVKVRNYNLKGDYEQHKQLGVVAQELEQVFPSLVDESIDKDKDGNDLCTKTKSVKYSVFVPMLIKAIQELKAEVDSLKQQLGK